MDNTEKWVWTILLVIIGVMAVYMTDVYFDGRECEKAGGVYLRTATGYQCVKAERIKP